MWGFQLTLSLILNFLGHIWILHPSFSAFLSSKVEAHALSPWKLNLTVVISTVLFDYLVTQMLGLCGVQQFLCKPVHLQIINNKSLSGHTWSKIFLLYLSLHCRLVGFSLLFFCPSFFIVLQINAQRQLSSISACLCVYSGKWYHPGVEGKASIVSDN